MHSSEHPHKSDSQIPSAAVKGRIFDVQTFSIHDGPGIRTTVFLKGCPLRCVWCHNPESMETEPDVGFIPAKCIACGQCTLVCTHEGHAIVDGRHVFQRALCVRCGSCTTECPTGALELAGKEVTAAWVMSEVEKDRMFYERSGGGITLSGGEPLMQPEFSTALLRLARDSHLHTAVDTSGYAGQTVFDRVTALADLVLFDIKMIDERAHRRLAGVSNRRILRNLQRLLRDENGPKVWLRLPVIPGQNDSPDAIQNLIDFCASLWGNPRLEAIHLMPYHRLAESKYQEFGKRYLINGTHPPADEDISAIIRRFSERGVPVTRS